MTVQDNALLKFALRFVGSSAHFLPEGVILAYLKVASLNKSILENNLSQSELQEFEDAVNFFNAQNLDSEAMKNNLSTIINLVDGLPRAKETQEAFKNYLLSDDEQDFSSILNQALAYAYIPVSMVFGIDEDYDDSSNENIRYTVREYIDMLQSEKRLASCKAADEEESGLSIDDIYDELYESEDANNFDDLAEKYRNAIHNLTQDIMGQDAAIIKFLEGYNQGELLKNSEKKNRPRSYHFFFGPPGVGKTFLAEKVGEELGLKVKIFPMSNYASDGTYRELIGYDPSYQAAKEGELTNFALENPKSIIVFDEVEKAHLQVIRMFLELLGTGCLTSGFSHKEVDFRDTILIFTSNVGKQLYDDRSVNLAEVPEKVLLDAVAKEKKPGKDEYALPPEICSRIGSGNIVIFNHLKTCHLAAIIRRNFNKFVDLMKQEYNIDITFPDELVPFFLFARGADIDGRIASSKSMDFLKDEVFELIRQSIKSQSENSLAKIEFAIEWENLDEKLLKLFVNTSKAGILVLADKKFNFRNHIDASKYNVFEASSIEEAKELLKNAIDAIFIDPLFGSKDANDDILSLADYNTQGVEFFHELVFKNYDIPIFLLETGAGFANVDCKSFILEGAYGTVKFTPENWSVFCDELEKISHELFMEQSSKDFSQRGWVISYNTKQSDIDEDGVCRIDFYDLKKRMAIDMESKGSILSDAERPKVKFADIIGAEDAKSELMHFVEYLKNPRAYMAKGGRQRPPKGVLLYGPPGTGKTMLAKAMAGESDITFLQATAAGFANKYIGESEANIRRLFKNARKYAPAIIFIDEIDAIGKQRTGSEFAASTEKMLNTLLTEMDGFSSEVGNKPVFVLAATNFGAGVSSETLPSLDEALLRRFDNKIYVDLPNEEERLKYISLMLGKRHITTVSQESMENVAERTTGKSLAILQNIIDLALREAAKAGKTLEDADLLDALENYIYGQKREHSYDYYKSVAYHEIGHAYLSYLAGDKPAYITIESRGNFGGYMQHSNQEDKPNYTKEELLARIRCAMGGRAAEKVFYGDAAALNTGASSDLMNATNIAFQIVCNLGMDENNLVVMSRQEVMQSVFAAEYLKKVNAILTEQMNEAVKTITEGKDKINLIVRELLKKNRLTGAEFEALMEQK